MNAYKTYLDRQTLSPHAHDRLMALGQTSKAEKTAGTVLAVGTTEEPSLCLSKKKTVSLQKWSALAACAALLLGLGAYGLGQAGGPVPPHSSTPVADPLASPDPEGDSSTSVSSSEEGDRYGFVALSGEDDKMPFPTLPDIAYPEGGSGLAASIALPPGSYANPLHEEDVEVMLWGSLENKDYAHFKAQSQGQVGSVTCTVPAALFWDGFGLTGEARYDGEGNLWRVTLQGSDGTERFTIEMAPGKLPPTCLVPPEGEISEVNGVDVTAWSSFYDSDGDGVKEYHYESAFLTGGIGVRAKFVVPETADVSQEENENGSVNPLYDMHSDLFIKYVCGNPNFTLDHLLTDDNIPPWEETSFETLEEARQRTDFAPYLPEAAPENAGTFFGRLSYQEGEYNYLFVRWTKMYDNIEVEVRLPEGISNYYFEPTDVNAPERYDYRLYDGPISDAVPEAYRADFYSPTFHAADMSLEVVKARETAHDTGGSSFRFHVLHENGVVVGYTCDGTTAEAVWALVEPTL